MQVISQIGLQRQHQSKKPVDGYQADGSYIYLLTNEHRERYKLATYNPEKGGRTEAEHYEELKQKKTQGQLDIGIDGRLDKDRRESVQLSILETQNKIYNDGYIKFTPKEMQLMQELAIISLTSKDWRKDKEDQKSRTDDHRLIMAACEGQFSTRTLGSGYGRIEETPENREALLAIDRKTRYIYNEEFGDFSPIDNIVGVAFDEEGKKRELWGSLFDRIKMQDGIGEFSDKEHGELEFIETVINKISTKKGMEKISNLDGVEIAGLVLAISKIGSDDEMNKDYNVLMYEELAEKSRIKKKDIPGVLKR